MEIDLMIKKAAREAAAEALRSGEAAREGKLLPEYLNTEEAAAYLSLSRQFLEIGRHKGYGPRAIKLSRAVRYKRSDLDAWMAQHYAAPSGGKSAA